MALSEKGVVRLKGNNKDEQKEESFTVNTKEYDLLISLVRFSQPYIGTICESNN